jgi:hypothetical protein
MLGFQVLRDIMSFGCYLCIRSPHDIAFRAAVHATKISNKQAFRPVDVEFKATLRPVECFNKQRPLIVLGVALVAR